jgi:hypothetical protein
MVRLLRAGHQQSLHSHTAQFQLQGKVQSLHESVTLICQATWLEYGNPARRELMQQNILLQRARKGR